MKYLARSPKEIGHAIREARKARKLTQKDLAIRRGVWQETISKIENGQSGTKMETIFDLLSALDLDVNIEERSEGSSKTIEDIF